MAASTSTSTTSLQAESVFMSAACNSFSQCLAWAEGIRPSDEVRPLEWECGGEVGAFALGGGTGQIEVHDYSPYFSFLTHF